MADTTFVLPIPSLKARDNGDGTHSVSAGVTVAPGTGTDITFADILPPLKAVDNGDGTYSIAIALVI